MEAFVALDVAIGLVFIYLLLAICCTAVNEWIAGVFRLRAGNLKTAISRLVDDHAEGTAKRAVREDRLSASILKHPLIESMKDGKRGPSYIPAPRFVAAFKDTLESHRAALAASDKASVKKATNTSLVADVQHVERQLAALKRTTPPRIRAAAADAVVNETERDDDDRVEEWFNQAMERATGWYRRKVMFITIALAVVITVLSNADTIAAAKILWHNPSVRAAVITQAQERLKRPRPEGNGLFVQADYPNKDKPVSDTSGEPGEQSAEEDRNPSDDDAELASESTGLTDSEKAALGLMIGWSREFKGINSEVCTARQKRINEACKVAETSAECTKAIDEGTAGGVCIQSGNGLEPTEAFPKGASLVPLIGTHLLGWLLTAIAVSMGAPFWFDTLKLFMSVRSSGKSPDEKKK